MCISNLPTKSPKHLPEYPLFFLAVPSGLQDLVPQLGGWIHAPCSKRAEPYQWTTREIPKSTFEYCSMPKPLLLRCVCVCVLNHFSWVWLFATQWTVACQAPLSMGFSRVEYWSGCHFLLQGIFLTQGWNSSLLCLLHLAARFFTTNTTWEVLLRCSSSYYQLSVFCKLVMFHSHR